MTRAYSRSFIGGELTPEFFGQIADSKFQTGLAICRNFRILPHGPAQNRAGFEFVREVKDSTKRVRLLPFTYSTEQTMALEVGDGYVRFHTQGATLLSGAVPYEVATSYTAAEVFAIRYVQSSDVLTLVHTAHPPAELKRMGALSWSLTPISFAATISPPTSIAVTSALAASPGTLTRHRYAVTAVASNNTDESLLSSPAVDSASTTISAITNASPGVFTATMVSSVFGVPIPIAHRLSVGDPISISGVTGMTGVNGSGYVVASVPTTTTFTVSRAGASLDTTALGAYAGGGVFSLDDGTKNNLFDTGASNTISWAAASSALRYNVYKNSNGLWGYLGQTSGTTFIDDNITPDVSKTPPEASNPFTGNSIVSVPVTAAGSGYAGSVPGLGILPGMPVRLTITDASGSGALAYASVNITTGAITGVVVSAGGSGYTAPTFTIPASIPGAGAAFGAAVLSGFGNYPGAVTYFEQRRCFAGTINKPQNLWMTRSGTESNLTYSIPTRDADAIAFRVVAREANTVRHLVPLTNLVALTSSAEWRVTSLNTDALTPSSISVKPQSYVGAGDAQPVVVNNNVIYAAARGGHAREMAYNWQAGGYVTGDLSLRVPHLVDGLEIVDMAFSKSPYPIVWMVSSNGKLLGLTYVPEQQVGAWHQHDTDGAFESVCVVAEGVEDVLYAVVRRTISGVQKRYVERMRPRPFATQADCFFVDSGMTYSGAPATTISGLGHLEGKTVNILADGAVHRQLVVASGAIALDIAASKVQVGLPIVADLQSLPLAIEIPGYGQGTNKNVSKVFLRVSESSGMRLGPAFDQLVEAKTRTTEAYGSPPRLQTRVIEVVTKAAWSLDGQVCVRQSDPLPLTVVSMTLDLATGG